MTEFLDAVSAAGLDDKAGKQAIKGVYRNQLDVSGVASFSGSVDLDEHFKDTEPIANRWDYGVGFKKAMSSLYGLSLIPPAARVNLL